LCFAFPLCALAQGDRSTETLEADAEGLLNQITQANNNKDFDRLLALVHPDCIAMWPDPVTLQGIELSKGRPAIKSYLTRLHNHPDFSSITFQMKLDKGSVHRINDILVFCGTMTVQGETKVGLGVNNIRAHWNMGAIKSGEQLQLANLNVSLFEYNSAAVEPSTLFVLVVGGLQLIVFVLGFLTGRLLRRKAPASAALMTDKVPASAAPPP
jgi:hypothetical protein